MDHGVFRLDLGDRGDRVESLAVASHPLQLRRRWQVFAGGTVLFSVGCDSVASVAVWRQRRSDVNAPGRRVPPHAFWRAALAMAMLAAVCTANAADAPPLLSPEQMDASEIQLGLQK